MKNLESMTNKEFIFTCLTKLKESGKLTEDILALLTDSNECKRRFHCSSGFSVLMEVPFSCTDDELEKLCHFGAKRRYYQERFYVGDRTYVIVNHWYGSGKSMPDNRTPFMKWVECQIG